MIRHIKQHVNKFCSLVIIVLLSGCAASTQVVNTWKNKDITPNQYDKIFVAALTGSAETKELVENELAIRLQDQGITVVKSLDVMNVEATEDQLEGDQEDKKRFIEKIRAGGSDAIITVAVVDVEDDTHYVPGNITYDPTVRFNFYGDFWGYYSHYDPIANQGYYEDEKTYFMETNLYDTKTEKLVWSAQSRSYNPSDEEAFSGEYAQVTIEEMEKEKVIK